MAGKIGKSSAVWLGLDEAALIFRMTLQGFSKVVRPLLKSKDIQKAGQRGTKIDAGAAIAAYFSEKIRRAEEAAVAKADPLLVGGDSPSLEEYRKQRAIMARMDVEERRKTHIDIREFQTLINRITSLLRGGTEAVQRRFGNDASDIIGACLDEIEKILRDELKKGE